MQFFVVARLQGGHYRDHAVIAALNAQAAAALYLKGRTVRGSLRVWRIPPAPGRVARELHWAWEGRWATDLACVKTSYDTEYDPP